jgi:DNA-binding transcriptional regulator YiaG
MTAPYQYTLSGLDNVYLVDGYELSPDGDLSIADMHGLHRAIGRYLIGAQTNPEITGAQLRFLRTHLDMSKQELAELMKVTEQEISQWEQQKNAPIPGPADVVIRVAYSEFIAGEPTPLDRVRVISRPPAGRRVEVRRHNDEWQIPA